MWRVIQNGDFYFEVEDEETKLIKETPYELLKDIEKKQLSKNEEAKMTIYNALPRKEYEHVFMCKTTKEVWHTLIITHQGNSQVKNCKIDLLTQEYENLKSLDPDYSSKNHVRKFLRALPLKWRAKVMTIEEAKDLATLLLDELIGNLTVYEMVLDNDGVDFKTTKEKVKSLSLKAKVTREQNSDDSDSQGESDEEKVKAFNLLARNFRKFFRKSNRFGRGNQFGNGENRFGKSRDNNFGYKSGEGSKPKGACLKFLRALPLKWRAKVTTIEAAKDLATLPLDEIIRNLTVYEMVLDNDGVDSKTTKEKVKSLSLKAKVTREQTSDDSDSQGESYEEEVKAFNLLDRNF
ncbi:hypothetical protein Tco_1460639 [Tanacetum coccineum]